LDRVSPNHPVYLVHNSGHLAVANQRAFDVAGIRAQTRIEGIVYGEDGQLTGLLMESSALESITKHVPVPTANSMVEDIGRAVHLCHRAGVTASADAAMGLGNPASLRAVWEAYQ
jgi:predicted amidohydrolase YtcJ